MVFVSCNYKPMLADHLRCIVFLSSQSRAAVPKPEQKNRTNEGRESPSIDHGCRSDASWRSLGKPAVLRTWYSEPTRLSKCHCLVLNL